MELTPEQSKEIAQATIDLLRRSVVVGAYDTQTGNQHVEIRTETETWKRFWSVIPQAALEASKIEG